MQINAKELIYSYGKTSSGRVNALSGVNLEIASGEFCGIIGETGSGKSTFVQHLNGLLCVKKNCGALTVGEFDLTSKKCDLKKLRARAGMVFQYPEYQLFAETVEEDVAFGVKNFMPDKTEKERAELVEKALNMVGLDYNEYAKRSPFDLSGGQKRRAAIAGVIVTKPEVLILDEPVAGLDPAGKRDFVALLKKLHADFVKTIIVVSHDMDFIAENCSAVAVFKDGKVSFYGTPKETFLSGEAKKAGLGDTVITRLTESLKAAGADVESDLTAADFIEKFAAFYFNDKGGNAL